ncbi:MAG: DUF362 domain-containing protein [Puniceicoccaceae bacterium]
MRSFSCIRHRIFIQGNPYRTCAVALSLMISLSAAAQSLTGSANPNLDPDANASATTPMQTGPLDRVWVAQVPNFEPSTYQLAVPKLIQEFESESGLRLEPGEKGKVGIKIYTNSGAGLRTPPTLVNALVDFLVQRGYDRKDLFLIDLNLNSLWRSGYLSSRADTVREFNGVPVFALNEGRFFHPEWFYDSPLPSQYLAPLQLLNEGGYDVDFQMLDDRKSFLPVPLLLDVDFWVNLPIVSDHPDLGINGVLANATLWNVSNQFRFMNNMAGASAAIAEIAAIPELRRGWVFSIVSLEKLQFMGGPIFNSNYVREFNEIYLSSNPVALDRIFLEKLNRARETMGFTAVSPVPPLFEYARSLDLGDFDRNSYTTEIISLP